MGFENTVWWCDKHEIVVTYALAEARKQIGKHHCFEGCKHLKQVSYRTARKLLKRKERRRQ